MGETKSQNFPIMARLWRGENRNLIRYPVPYRHVCETKTRRKPKFSECNVKEDETISSGKLWKIATCPTKI